MTRVMKIMGGIVALSALSILGTTDVAAQNVEAIMRAQERLELTEDQLASLDAIRQQAVQERTAAMAEREEMRSRLDAGLVERSEVMALAERQRDARQATAEQRRERIDAVLTDSQREQLQEMRSRQNRMARGARPGPRPGVGRPGLAPRGRPGVAPRGRPGGRGAAGPAGPRRPARRGF